MYRNQSWRRDSRGRVFKQAIVRVEHLLGHEEEPLPGYPSVVKSLFALKFHPETCFQQVGTRNWEDASVRILQDRVSSYLHFKAIRDVGLCGVHSGDGFCSRGIMMVWHKETTARLKNSPVSSASSWNSRTFACSLWSKALPRVNHQQGLSLHTTLCSIIKIISLSHPKNIYQFFFFKFHTWHSLVRW